MALTPEQLAELQRLKQMYAPLVEAQRRRDQADANAQKMGIPLTPPMDKKADGGLAEFLKDSAVKHRVYHGTADDFSEFKYHPERAIGIWLAKEPDVASGYSDIAKRAGKNPSVMPLHVSLKNPANRAQYLAARKIAEAHSDKHGYADHNKRHREILQSQGFDGVDLGDAYIAFHPHQIKSAIGNRGTYDPNDPDITKATGGSIPSMDVMRLAIGGQGPKNWLKGSVERVIDPLKVGPRDAESNFHQVRDETSPTGWRTVPNPPDPINLWIERNLANYIKKQMATHDDPIRKLAEQGIVHMPPEQMGYGSSQAEGVRKKHGAPRLGQSPEAQAWEDATDVAMHKIPVSLIDKKPFIGKSNWEPWMEKADPNTEVFHPTDSMHAHYLGFDHLVDILKEDLASGRIRPEQLSKVSIEHAVRRAHEYDQEKKRKMAETALKATEGMPVHKDYGDGFKWIELAMPRELPEGYSQTPAGTYVDPEGKQSIHHPNYGKLEDALKYEGDTMGHCVGGYCPDVASGNTRIFSLRDAKNEPHVTIEVKPNFMRAHEWLETLSPEERQEVSASQGSITEHPKYLAQKHSVPPMIKQIKGKGNAKPKKDYIPYVQDFVKSGKWSDVGDIQNADMHQAGNLYTKNERKNLERLTGENMDYVAHQDIPKHRELLKQHNVPPLMPEDKADGGEVDAEEVFMGKGGKVKELEQYLRDREGDYGLKRLQRAADEIPGLENMYTLDALKRAFGGDNAKALMTMNPADFEKFAVRLFPDPDTREEEMEERIEHVRGLPPMNHHEYIEHLAKIKGGFADVPFLEVDKRPEYLPNISGHEGRHRSRAMMVKGAQKSLVQLFPTGRMREPMPRRHREDFIEAMKKELGEKRLVTGEGRSLLPADLEAPEHKNIERRNMLGGRPQLPEIYKDGGEVDAESYFFPNKE